MTTYNGFPSGSLVTNLPMLFKRMWGSYDSAFYIQNTDPGVAANVEIKYFDVDGNLSCTQHDTIPALATHGTWVPAVGCLP